MNLLIDGSSLLWRSHHANKAQHKATTENDIYIFIKNTKTYASMYNSKSIYIAWDKKICKELNFRQTEVDCDYKGTRDKGEAQQVYASQPMIHEATEALGCKNLYPWMMEADDIIAWLSKTLEGQNVVITTDGDMLQLINSNTCVFNPRKKLTIDDKNFETELGMPIEHFLPYKAILGDSSDNIKGVAGYGKVYSKRLAKEWVDKEEIAPEHIAIIEKNIKLMDLNIGYTHGGDKEVDVYKEQLEKYNGLSTNFENFEKICDKYNFELIINDMSHWKSTFQKSGLMELLSNMNF